MKRYKLLSKKENESGVVLRFEESTEIETPIPSESWFTNFAANVGLATLDSKKETKTQIIEVFYPVENRVHFATSLSYLDGRPVPSSELIQMMNLMKIAKFKETPAKQFVVD